MSLVSPLSPPVALMLCALLSGCPGGDPDDAGARDAGPATDAAVDAGHDAASVDGSSFDAVAPPCGTNGSYVDQRGFCIRVPQVRTVPYDSFGGGSETIDVPDKDHVCTLIYDGVDGFVYVQAHATEFRDMGGGVMQTDGAWTSIGGEVLATTGSYDWGGNHANDAIEIVHDGKQYRYYHSSFGFGWRACHAPDCLQIYDGVGGALIEDGCTSERSVPAVCVQVELDGGVPPLVDDFEPCPGDPNVDAG